MRMNNKINSSVNLLISGRFISFIGTGIYNICLPLYLINITNSLMDVGVIYATIFMPVVFVTPLIGAFIQKHNVKYCLVISDYINSLLFLLMLILFKNNLLTLSVIVILSIIINIFSSIFSISSSSIFTALVHQDKLEKYNAIKSTSDNMAMLIAPLLGTFLFSIFGFELIIFINFLSFIFSAIFESFIKYQQIKNLNEFNQNYSTIIQDGSKMIYSNKNLLYCFILIMSLNFLCSPTEEIFAPGILIVIHNIKPQLFGISSLSFVVGILAGSIFITNKYKINLLNWLKHFFYIQGIIMVTIGILSCLLVTSHTQLFLIIYCFSVFVSGFVMTLVNIPIISNFQKIVKPSKQAIFFSLQSFFSQLMIPLGTFFAGFTSEKLGADIAYLLNGLIMLVVIYLSFKKINFNSLDNNIVK